ncbi:MAG: patatin-like phospholipase family protein [Deltaproteobacteria bacterium]|nr:patatin-like phospholipase family protein [Deltaproteobacteria bacterium]MBW2400141.1 patatin-like phospholipase family protein [Deltaproteobacteria bacterium]
MVLVAVLWSLAACATTPPANHPVERGSNIQPEFQAGLAAAGRSEELFLVTTFSGGGTRAAAFAYGVLQELAATDVTIGGEPRRLVDEVDLISSVSGGSFTAAYYGLFGDRIFEDYEKVFLRRNLQGRLILEMLRPINWLRLFRVDRSQLAADFYDREIFEGATFADFRRVDAPEIVINATDLSTAGRFPFSPISFGLICSDLESYPVANAVMASSAVPIAFPTIRLSNHAGSCNFEVPGWLQQPPEENAPIALLAKREFLASYEKGRDRRFIHLLDGGLSDNLGLRNAVAAITVAADPLQMMREIGHGDIRQILVLVVNAEQRATRQWGGTNRTASPRQVMSSLSGRQIHNTNRITIELARKLFNDLGRTLSRPGAPVAVDFVEVSFEMNEDTSEREFLGGVETSLRLSAEKVDRLISAGRGILRSSPAFQRAVGRMGAAKRE